LITTLILFKRFIWRTYSTIFHWRTKNKNLFIADAPLEYSVVVLVDSYQRWKKVVFVYQTQTRQNLYSTKKHFSWVTYLLWLYT